VKSLLEQTRAKIYVLVRSSDECQGRQRLRAAMESMGSCAAGLMQMFEARVKISRLRRSRAAATGPGAGCLDLLAAEIDTVFHNGATVNYLFNYDRMRDANVQGTNEVLRLAFERRPKSFNYVSTTFVFAGRLKKSCMRPT